MTAGRPTIHDCHAQGMTISQAAEAMGLTYTGAYYHVRKHGLTMHSDLTDMKATISAAKIKWHADPKNNRLALLTDDEREAYRTLARQGARRAEALAILGRSDIDQCE